MSNFPGPPSWSAATTYTANKSMINSGNGYYWLCTTSGTSGSVQPTWPVHQFGYVLTDNTAQWTCAQNSRKAWVANTNYTSGEPTVTTGTFSSGSASITSIGGTGSYNVGIGSLAISFATPYFSSSVVSIPNTTSVVISNTASYSGTYPVTFTQSPYPLPDQIITSGSVVVQCVVPGTSASAQPTWPTVSQLTLNTYPAGYYQFNVVPDNTVQWTQAGYYPNYFTLSSTSSTSASVSIGSKTFTTQSGLSYTNGAYVQIVNSTGTGYLGGTVTSYSGTSLVVSVSYVLGTGTYTSWRITQQPNSQTTIWLASATHSYGDLITANGYTWQCTAAGTSGSVAPGWTSIVDGTAIWQVVGTN